LDEAGIELVIVLVQMKLMEFNPSLVAGISDIHRFSVQHPKTRYPIYKVGRFIFQQQNNTTAIGKSIAMPRKNKKASGFFTLYLYLCTYCSSFRKASREEEPSEETSSEEIED
jgi:hypothetical protein